MDEIKQEIDIITTPEEFFRELVTLALSSQKVQTDKNVEHYLVALLQQFLHVEQLNRIDKEPLALQYYKALLSSPEEREVIYRCLGDYSLYVSGFFSESLSRKVVDVDYYIKMGEIAYKHVSTLTHKKDKNNMFLELSNNFGSFVDVLTEVSHKTLISTESKDILRLYEKWLKTKNDRFKKLLHEHGLDPVDIGRIKLND